ncbi:hypothetical protein E1293_29870 [Actinomadura darangshiensis]|uniref:Uncharacterized protein n=1 Tax=Actinomadura darangshiensis TaxID=705336 RepID=A0A4R5AMU0_9ACTN|nr:hypothetical protein [Actinomadura darangshiensis]TDD74228.1 hypothetical protein E1293_29870 [Actinomadura darangshiensis]
MSLRYYLYISDAKIDMLLPRVDPGFGRKRTSEVGMSVTLLAKRLLHGPSPYPELDGSDGMTVLVGSPLFAG